MKPMFVRSDVAAHFSAWTDWFGPEQLDMMLFEVERVMNAIDDARFPAHEPGFFGDDAQGDWLAAVERSRNFLRRLVKRPAEHVGKPPAPLEGIDPLVAAIWDVFDLPESADGIFVQGLADACRAGEPVVGQSGIRSLKLKRLRQGPGYRDLRWRHITAAVHKWLYPLAHDRTKDWDAAQFVRDRVLRSAVRAICCAMGIQVSDSSISNYLAKLRLSLAVADESGKRGYGNLGELRVGRVFDHNIDPSLFDIDYAIESLEL